MPQLAQGEDFTRDLQNIDSSSTNTGLMDSDSDKSNADLDLLHLHTAIAAPPLNASTEELHKASLRIVNSWQY